MKAAVVVPPKARPTGPSGGLRGLHYVSRELRDMGVEAVTVGVAYPYENPIGDTILHHSTYEPDEDTALILPEGYDASGAGDLDTYYYAFLEKPHGPVVVYAQNSGFCYAYNEREDFYWGLGERHNALVSQKAGLPEGFHVERLLLPIDTMEWSVLNQFGRIPGTILYGSRRNASTLDAVARRCSSKTAFRVAGCRPEEVRKLMEIADIFVLASATEGQSVFANEAMAMEMAVVTWESGGMPDIITHGETGLLVAQNDVMGLVDCVRNIQDDHELARKLGKNAREWVKENLSWDRFREDLKSAWKKVASWTPASAPPAKEQAGSSPTT